MKKMTGSCLCGDIRYAAETSPIMTAVCHCNDCQRQAGSAFTVVVAVPRSALVIEGDFKTFNGKGASGKAAFRHFCPGCGSPIFSEVDAMPGVAFVKAGTLDDRSWLRPTMALWCETAQPWTKEPIEMQRFKKMPV
jgi:hypothetical protein